MSARISYTFPISSIVSISRVIFRLDFEIDFMGLLKELFELPFSLAVETKNVFVVLEE